MRVAVFPVRYAMRLENADSFGSADSHLQSPYRAGSVSGEIRQIREYRDGDRIRYIHWNQTARTGELWVKEYEEEQNGQYSLYLERRAGQTPAAFDAYCTLLDALLSALLAAAGPVRVLWREAQYPGIREFYVRDGEQCRELLYLLYQANETPFDDLNRAMPDEMMRLTPELGWYLGNRLIFRFSEDKLAAELTQKTFTLR